MLDAWNLSLKLKEEHSESLSESMEEGLQVPVQQTPAKSLETPLHPAVGRIKCAAVFEIAERRSAKTVGRHAHRRTQTERPSPSRENSVQGMLQGSALQACSSPRVRLP